MPLLICLAWWRMYTCTALNCWFKSMIMSLCSVTAGGGGCLSLSIILTLQNATLKANTQLLLSLSQSPSPSSSWTVLNDRVFAYTEALSIFNVCLRALGRLMGPVELFHSRSAAQSELQIPADLHWEMSVRCTLKRDVWPHRTAY